MYKGLSTAYWVAVICVNLLQSGGDEGSPRHCQFTRSYARPQKHVHFIKPDVEASTYIYGYPNGGIIVFLSTLSWCT